MRELTIVRNRKFLEEFQLAYVQEKEKSIRYEKGSRYLRKQGQVREKWETDLEWLEEYLDSYEKIGEGINKWSYMLVVLGWTDKFTNRVTNYAWDSTMKYLSSIGFLIGLANPIPGMSGRELAIHSSSFIWCSVSMRRRSSTRSRSWKLGILFFIQRNIE